MNDPKFRALLFSGCVVFLSTLAAPVSAAIVLDFAGLDALANEGPADYYNGGAGSLGSVGGTNYGISFGTDTLTCASIENGGCNTSEIPGGPGANAISFLSGPGDVMNVSAGFTDGFSFFYTSPFSPGTVTVWSGLDGTGTLLATLSLSQTVNGVGDAACNGANYCPYVASGVSFAGVAESVDFSGTANGIGFGDITIGSQIAGAVPEPGGMALVLAGLSVLGIRSRLQRRRKAPAG